MSNAEKLKTCIDIKFARIIFQAMVFKPTDSTFLASNQLTTTLSCYCTVHVYDSIWSYWVEAYFCRLDIVCFYLHFCRRSRCGWFRPITPWAGTRVPWENHAINVNFFFISIDPVFPVNFSFSMYRT